MFSKVKLINKNILITNILNINECFINFIQNFLKLAINM